MSPLSVEPETLDEPPQAKPAPQITYESAAPVSRRQFRFLFMLTLLNTILLGFFVAGPGISRITSGWWQDYKKWQADRLAAQQKLQAQQKFAADYQAALQFTAPKNQVVYEEDRQRAAKLLAGSPAYSPIHANNFVYIAPEPWQLPVFRESTGLPPPFRTTRDATVFLHGRKTPTGIERVVHVEFNAAENIRKDPPIDSDQHLTVSNERYFICKAYESKPDSTFDHGISRALQIFQAPDKRIAITWTMGAGNRWENGSIKTNLLNVFRIFAGQADPKDDTHFTIAYELDGKPGIIDGWFLKDETVALQPREGRIFDDDSTGRERKWDPYAPPPTNPIVAPDLPPAPSRKN